MELTELRHRTKVTLAAVLAAVLVVTAVWIGVDRIKGKQAVTGPTAGPNEISLVPVRADAAGVDPAAGFRLASARPLTAAVLRQQLTVQPAIDLNIEQADSAGHEFHVQPARPLEADRIYRFQLAAAGAVSRPYGWAFQTKTPFRVIGTLPRDHSTGVPLETGIEFTFSHENYADPEAFFSVSPKVAGRFERHRKTIAFVPASPLAPETIYSVTLKQGLSQTGADGKLGADVSFAFETQPAGGGKGGGEVWFQVPDEVQEFPVGEPPYFQLWYGKNGAQSTPQVGVSVYRYKDAAGFIDALGRADKVPWWSSAARSRYQEEVSGLAKVAAFNTGTTDFAGVGSYLVFPEKLQPGYYLAAFTVDGHVRHSRFQVTDISSYLTVTTSQTLVWLNDLATKAPLRNAQVQLSGAGASAVTDGDGVAVLPTPAASLRDGPSGPSGLYLHVQGPGGKEAVVGAQGNVGNGYFYYGNSPDQLALRYWRYLYLDRSLYKPDDVVNLWGIVRPREPGAAPVAEVTAEVRRSEDRDPAGQPIPLARADFKVVDGTYTGAVRLPGLRPGWYELQVRMGTESLLSQWFEVQTYTKPAYQLDLTQDRRAIFDGEAVNFQVKTTFFDGTPVPNLNLAYGYSSGKDSGGSLTTDANGEASLRYSAAVPGNEREWGGANGVWVNIHSALPEAGEIATGASVTVYSRDVTVSPQIRVEQGQARVTAKVNHVTLERINAGDGWDVTGAAAGGRPVRGSLNLVRFNKRETGEYYDFLQKRVVKQYYYEQVLTEVSSFTGVTDSAGNFAQTLAADPAESYQLDMQVADTHGRWVFRQLHFSGKSFQQYENSPYRYFMLTPTEPGKDSWPSDKPITLILQEGEKPVPDRAKSFLFLAARLGLQGYQVQDSGAYAYTLKPTDPPNTNIRGVYFDGRLYRETSERALQLDPAERQLKVKVTPDKATYRPGETVSVKVEAVDRQGRPAQAARVNLNLVDEALFALRDQQVDTLQTLYQDRVPSGILRTRSSHHVPSPGSGAEKGGEGGGVRKDFRDAVFFNTVVTDSQGRATASFQVPDNLTMWRLTWQAVAPASMEAASGTVGIPVKLPFFVEANPGESFLTGDKPAVLLRSYGTALREGQSVSYQVKLSGPGGELESTVEGKAFTPAHAALPELRAGTYKLTVRGAAPGGLEDALEKSFTVADSYVRQNKVETFLLDQATRLTPPEKGLATLTFTDYHRSRYLRLLQELRWQWGNRLEQNLSRSVATDLLKRHFDYSDLRPEPDLNMHAFQTPEGAVAILPYADGDLKLSALAADLAPDRFDQTALALYFQKLLEKPETDQEHALLALYGLAALDRPVLQTVRGLLPGANLSLTERLYLALATAAAGDLESARPLYQEMAKQYREEVGTAARIKEGRDQDEILARTALMAVLAAKLGEMDAPAYAEYLMANPGKDLLFSMEEALVAKAALPRLSSEAVTFTYTLDGKEERRQLKPGDQFRLPLPASAVADLRFKDVKGQVGLTVAYEATVTGADLKKEDGFSIVRSFSAVGKGPGAKLAAGDLVKVTLAYRIPETAPGGGYELTDSLPAGLRVVERPWQYGVRFDRATDPAWPISVNGQRVTFYAWKAGDPLAYYARVTSAGAFTWDSAILQHQTSGRIFTFGPREQVQIQ